MIQLNWLNKYFAKWTLESDKTLIDMVFPSMTWSLFKALHFLAKQRILTSEQLFKWVSLYEDRNYVAFLNRLTLLQNQRVISRKEYSLGQVGFYFYVYRIAKRGLDILKDLKCLTPDECSIIARENMKNANRKNVDHELGVQQVITNTSVLFEQDGIDYHSTSAMGSTFFKEEGEAKGKVTQGGIVPDWVVEKENRFLFLDFITFR
jgi:hypothetical protein